MTYKITFRKLTPRKGKFLSNQIHLSHFFLSTNIDDYFEKIIKIQIDL